MKKIIKSIIFCICVIYLLLSVIFTTYQHFRLKKNLEDLMIASDSKTIEEKEREYVHSSYTDTEGISHQLSLVDAMQEQVISGQFYLNWEQRYLIGFSIFLGILIGLFLHVREYSKIKYVFYFLIGNILCNCIFSFVILFCYQHVGSTISYSYALSESFRQTFFVYTFFFMAFIGIIVLNNHIKVKKLNQQLQEKNKEL